MRIRLLIADSHALVREVINFWFANHAEIRVVGLAQSGHSAVDLACELQPDVVLMNMIMPCLDGLEATSEIVEKVSGTHVLILSDDIRSRSVRNAIEAGASGYFSVRDSPEELVQAIHQVFDGGTYLSNSVSFTIVQDYMRGGGGLAAPGGSSLTGRECQVLQLTVEGLNTKAIGHKLSLSPKTVDWHRSRIMKKLGIDSVAGLVRYAIQEGLSPLAVPSS